MAASYGADSVVKFLMERGADVTIRDTSLRSMLHAAVGDVKSMEALLQVKVFTVIMMIDRCFHEIVQRFQDRFDRWKWKRALKTEPPFVSAHTFCASLVSSEIFGFLKEFAN